MPPPPAPKAYCIIQGTRQAAGIKLLADLRCGVSPLDMDYGARSMKAQMRAADRAKARYAVIMGDDEVALGEVQLKSLYDGWQHKIPLAEVADWLSGDPAGKAPSPLLPK